VSDVLAHAAHTGRGEVATVRPALERVVVTANERIAQGVGLLVLHAPRTAATVRPGQFVHLRIAPGRDFLLRRPFSVHRASGETLEILYQVLGTGTHALAQVSRDSEMDLLGPLGTGWDVAGGGSHALLVAGGLGAAPLGMLAEALADKGVALTIVQGAPTSERLVARELFESVARRYQSATDDGSAGERGFVTLLSERALSAGGIDRVYACGPEAMSRTVAEQAAAAGVRCQVSLERFMACGIGACLSCVCATTRGRLRACLDGPVFEAADVLWDEREIPPRH
jgi:dihydroorotate dehydrogenase electron transfer subunit